MANIKSAKKRVLINQKNADRNKNFRSDLRTALKKATIALDTKTDDRADLVHKAMIKLDKASVKGILHINNAGRKKSQLARKLNQAG